MRTHARGVESVMAAGDGTDERTDERSASTASTAMQEHGAIVARVCMALLGDAAATERALERVARDAATTTFEDGKSTLVRLLALARVACASHLANHSRLPIRTTAAWGAGGGEKPEPKPAPTTTRETAREPAIARAAIGKLKPTEREAVVLHLVGGLDAAQIAEACGIDLETARQRVACGVSQLVQEEKKR
jgi:RNA polymerase sigma-70 factor (ECF subfamily)